MESILSTSGVQIFGAGSKRCHFASSLPSQNKSPLRAIICPFKAILRWRRLRRHARHTAGGQREKRGETAAEVPGHRSRSRPRAFGVMVMSTPRNGSGIEDRQWSGDWGADTRRRQPEHSSKSRSNIDTLAKPGEGDIHIHAVVSIAPSLYRITALVLLPSRNPFAKRLPGEPFLSGNQSLARGREPGELLGL